MLNNIVVVFQVFHLGNYGPMPVPSPPFKTIFGTGFVEGLQSCRRITPDVTNAIKMPSVQYVFYLQEEKKSLGARSCE
jgi:hypothetical protein